MSIASSSPSWKTNCFPIDERDIHLQRLMIPDLLGMNGLLTTRIGMYDAPYESYIRRSRWRIVATNLFSLSVCFMRKDTMAVFVIVWPAWQDIGSSLCSAYMYGMANACDTLGDSVLLLRFVLDHVRRRRRHEKRTFFRSMNVISIFGSSTIVYLLSCLKDVVETIWMTQGNLQADVDDDIVTNSLGSFPFLSSPVFVFHSGPCILTRRVTWRKKNTTSVLLNFCFTNLSLLVLGTWICQSDNHLFKCSRWTLCGRPSWKEHSKCNDENVR
jgi:hypothetical protein